MGGLGESLELGRSCPVVPGDTGVLALVDAGGELEKVKYEDGSRCGSRMVSLERLESRLENSSPLLDSNNGMNRPGKRYTRVS